MATLCNRGEEDVFDAQRWSNSISGEDTESVYSLQGKETELVVDTTDIESNSCEESIIDIEIEYDVASLSENEDIPFLDTSSGDEDFIQDVIVNALCDSSLDAFATDESSDNSMDDSRFRQVDFVKCVQCGGANANSLYRYCEKCFQVRKTIFPPRPQTKCKKRNDKKKIDLKQSLENYLNSNNGDSGIGTSEEISSLDFENIVVPTSVASSVNIDTKNSDDNLQKNLQQGKKNGESSKSTENWSVTSLESFKNEESEASEEEKPIVSQENKPNLKRRRQNDIIETAENKNMESGTSEDEKESVSEETKPNLKRRKLQDIAGTEEINNVESGDEKPGVSKEIKPNLKRKRLQEIAETEETKKRKSNETETTNELCIICNITEKNSIFLHGSIGHMACCYKCAKTTWKTHKRCPICNCKVNNVVKVFRDF